MFGVSIGGIIKPTKEDSKKPLNYAEYYTSEDFVAIPNFRNNTNTTNNDANAPTETPQ